MQCFLTAMTKAAMVPGVAVAAVAATAEAIAAVYAASAFLYRLKVCYPLPCVMTVFSQRRCLCYQRHREEEQSSASYSGLVHIRQSVRKFYKSIVYLRSYIYLFIMKTLYSDSKLSTHA